MLATNRSHIFIIPFIVSKYESLLYIYFTLLIDFLFRIFKQQSCGPLKYALQKQS